MDLGIGVEASTQGHNDSLASQRGYDRGAPGHFSLLHSLGILSQTARGRLLRGPGNLQNAKPEISKLVWLWEALGLTPKA